MACQKCTVSQTDICRSLNNLFEIYSRISEVHLVLERLERDAQDRTPWMVATLGSALNDLCAWLEAMEKKLPRDKDDENRLAELLESGGFHESD